jgi:hypothetical protein
MHKEAREGSSLPRNDLPDVSPPLDQSSQVASITTADKAKAEAYCTSKGQAPASETAVRQSRHKTRPSSPPNGRPISFATEEPTSFDTKTHLLVDPQAVAASGPEADDSPITTPAAGVDTDDAKWDKYPLGQLPDENDPDVPLGNMIGLRSMGGILADRFDVGVVGKVAPMTCIGAFVE